MLDLISAVPVQREDAVRPAHVSGTDDHEQVCPLRRSLSIFGIQLRLPRQGRQAAPTYAPVWEHLGLAYAKQGRHRDAVNAFERATKLLPGYNKQAWEHLAEEYHVVGRTADADQAAARAARLKNTPPQVAKRKG